MAVIVVTAENTRIEDAEDNTGYVSIGGGAGASSEASFPYQGSNLVNRKVTSSSGAGFYYDPTLDAAGPTQDMTATAKRTWMVKAIVTDFGGLQTTDGFVIRIGSGSNYYGFIIAGTDSPVPAMDAYRPIGGLLVFPVDPNENTTYNDTNEDTATSPTLTTLDYFGVIAKFATASAKSENVGLDAIDLGTGLFLVGGDGGSTDGVFQDFVDEDEGTVANRWGFARNGDGGTLLAYGNWRIGENAGGSVATEFVDSDAVILWLDGMFAAGFSVLNVNLSNATTAVTDGSLHIGVGGTTGIDRRPDYIVTGTSGVFTFTGTLRNFRNVTLTSASTINGDIECVDLTQGSADIENATIRTNAITNVAVIDDPTFGTTTDLNNTNFIQSGVGHAIEITTGATHTFTNLGFSGYGGTPGSNLVAASGAADAAIFNDTGGAVTISISGGDTPSIRNGAGATTTVQNTVTVSITALDVDDSSAISGARVLLLAATGGPLPFEASVTITHNGSSTATVTHTAHGLSSGQDILIQGADVNEYNGIHNITVVDVNTYDYVLVGSPITPATGTIVATAVILDGTTNGSGVIEDTAFNYTADQPIAGRVRKNTASPRYKNSPISGTIDSNGFSTTVFMIDDE